MDRILYEKEEGRKKVTLEERHGDIVLTVKTDEFQSFGLGMDKETILMAYEILNKYIKEKLWKP